MVLTSPLTYQHHPHRNPSRESMNSLWSLPELFVNVGLSDSVPAAPVIVSSEFSYSTTRSLYLGWSEFSIQCSRAVSFFIFVGGQEALILSQKIKRPLMEYVYLSTGLYELCRIAHEGRLDQVSSGLWGLGGAGGSLTDCPKIVQTCQLNNPFFRVFRDSSGTSGIRVWVLGDSMEAKHSGVDEWDEKGNNFHSQNLRLLYLWPLRRSAQ